MSFRPLPPPQQAGDSTALAPLRLCACGAGALWQRGLLPWAPSQHAARVEQGCRATAGAVQRAGGSTAPRPRAGSCRAGGDARGRRNSSCSCRPHAAAPTRSAADAAPPASAGRRGRCPRECWEGARHAGAARAAGMPARWRQRRRGCHCRGSSSSRGRGGSVWCWWR